MEYLKRVLSTTWNSILDFFIEKNIGNFAIHFDKFLYLVRVHPALPLIVQDYRDRNIRKVNRKNIICGSPISTMESCIGCKFPLYGRRTAQINVFQRDLRL